MNLETKVQVLNPNWTAKSKVRGLLNNGMTRVALRFRCTLAYHHLRGEIYGGAQKDFVVLSATNDCYSRSRRQWKLATLFDRK